MYPNFQLYKNKKTRRGCGRCSAGKKTARRRALAATRDESVSARTARLSVDCGPRCRSRTDRPSPARRGGCACTCAGARARLPKTTGRKKKYLVKWKGYTFEESTWEPQENFKGSALQKYHTQIKEQIKKTTRALIFKNGDNI